MDKVVEQLSLTARRAVQARNWPIVRACARRILERDGESAEGHFLIGLAEKALHRPEQATGAFATAVSLDKKRYDAAVELAGQYMRSHRYGDAVALVQRHESRMSNSPHYLNMAGTIYMNASLPARARPLLMRANTLQPGVDSLRAGLAACSVYLGRIEEAMEIYRSLLNSYPDHQRNHYELSRIARASDSAHIDEMKAVVRSSNRPANENIYIYYAIGKELEDLERWDEAFHYYKLAGDAAASVSGYDVNADLRLIETIIEVCSSDWLSGPGSYADPDRTPLFVVGLPRTGTTLIERILASHSQVESAGESYFIQIVLRRESGIQGAATMSPEIIRSASRVDIGRMARAYVRAMEYRLTDRRVFIEKFPENILYLGFIARAFPDARLIHVKRNPMDTCFAMYKQPFFRYAYTLEDLGAYYVAYERLHGHWSRLLGDRLIEVEYESLVSDQEAETRRLIAVAGLEFEEACMRFHENEAPSNTASTVQIREKIHRRSVGRWKHFEKHLLPLRRHLENAGIRV